MNNNRLFDQIKVSMLTLLQKIPKIFYFNSRLKYNKSLNYLAIFNPKPVY